MSGGVSWGGGASSISDVEQRRIYRACFGTDAGIAVIQHLRRLTIERRLGPDASEQALRHLEGQRDLVARIERLALAPDPDSISKEGTDP